MPTCKYKHLSRFVYYVVYIYICASTVRINMCLLLNECNAPNCKLDYRTFIKKTTTTLPLEIYSFSHDQIYHLAGQHFVIL